MYRSVVLAAALFLKVASANYALTLNCDHTNFFSCFTFYTGADPTNGYVQFVNQSYATSAGLINTNNNQVYIGVDKTHKYNPSGLGRPSIRLTSKTTYTQALYVFSATHMPYGCGTWPAFWSFGPNWPNNGEIDIIEGVNTNPKNLMSLHTGPDCTVAGQDEVGTLITNNCTSGPGTSGAGCGVQSYLNQAYGSAFNSAGGGVFAMEWTSTYIRIWFFRNNAVPSSIAAGNPDTSTFGEPAANFEGNCNIQSHFADHSIILDNTFCGDWAGNAYGSSGCPLTSGASGYQSCVDYVANNPTAFGSAYWSINYLKVFQQVVAAPASSSKLSSVKPAAQTKPVQLFDVAQGKVTTAPTPSKSSSLPTLSSTATTTPA